jgi:hypothetical protein
MSSASLNHKHGIRCGEFPTEKDSLLIAGECNRDIYIPNLSSVDDDFPDELFNKLPARGTSSYPSGHP